MKSANLKSRFTPLVLIMLMLGITFVQPDFAQAQSPTFELGLNKEFTPIAIPMGGISTLTVSIYNSNVYEAILSSSPPAWTDTLPAGVFFADSPNVSNDCGGTVTTIGTKLTLIGGTVPAKNPSTGIPGSCSVQVDVTSVVSNPSNHINIIPANTLNAVLVIDYETTVDATNPTDASATITVEQVNPPSIQKSFAPNTIWAGETSVLSIRIINNDDSTPLTNLSLLDIFPTNVVLASPPLPGDWNSGCGDATLTWVGGGSLIPGDSVIYLNNATVASNTSCTIKVNVVSAVPGVYTNIIPANTIQNDQSVTNPGAVNAPLNVQNFGISKNFSPSNFQVGGTSILTITLQNPSSNDYTVVAFTDNLPAGLTVVGTPSTPQCDGVISSTPTSVTLTGGVVPQATSGTPGSCSISFTVTSAVSSTFTNTIPSGALIAESPGGTVSNTLPANANLSVYALGAGVSGYKTFYPSTIPLSGISRLYIYITAPQDINLTNFTLTDALPTGVYVADSPNYSQDGECVGGTWAPSAGDTLLEYSGGTIYAGTQCRLRVYVSSDDPDVYTNTVSPANITNDENRSLTSSFSRTLYVSGLSVSKRFSQDIVDSDGLSRLTITLTNTNVNQLDNVSFTDNFPGSPTAGIIIADPPNAITTCPGASITAVAGSQTLQMSGGILPAQVLDVPGICTVHVDVVGKGNDTNFRNTINAGDVTATVHGTSTVISNPTSTNDILYIHNLEIRVVKGFDPVTAFGGSSSVLTIRLSNPETSTLTGITFTDELPQRPPNGGMYIANPPRFDVGTCGGIITGNPGDTSFTFSGGTLVGGANCELTLEVGMDVENNLTNNIPAGGVTTREGATNPDDADATLTNLPGASLTKYFGPNPIIAGETSTLSIEIRNVSNILLTGMGVIDTLPEGLIVSGTPVASQCNGGTVVTTADTITLTGGSLDAFDTCTIQVEVALDTDEGAVPGDFENCIPVGTLNNDQNASNSTEACDTLSITTEVLSPVISKSFSPNPIAAGETSVLIFVLTNPDENEVALTGVGFTDTFPTGVVQASVPNVSQCGGTVSSTSGSVTLTDGTIAVDDSCTVIINVTAASGGSYENTSGNAISTNGGTGNTASDTLEVIDPPSISKDFDANPITAGGNSTLTFTITNSNVTTVLAGVSFTDNLPTGLSVSPTPSTPQCGGTITSTSSSITLTDGIIPADDICTVTVIVTTPNGGEYNNTSGTVTSTNGGDGDTASDTLTVNGTGLSLVKSTSTISYNQVGDTIVYSYLLTNTGNANLYPPYTVTDDTASGVSCPVTPDPLLPDGTVTCTVIYTVDADAVTLEWVTNIASATAQDAASNGNTVTSNEDTVTVPLAALQLRKTTSTAGYLVVGDIINYNYTLTNVGKVTLYSPFEVIDDHIGSPLGTAFTCGSVTSLAVGANVSCSSIYTVVADDVTDGSVTNIANATAKDSGDTSVPSSLVDQTVTVYLVLPPVISKSFSPNPVAVGTASTLTFVITNPSTNEIPLSGVSFVDNLPSGLTVSAVPDTSQCGGTVIVINSNTRINFTGGSVMTDSNCTITVQVSAGETGSYVNISNNVNSANGGQGNTGTDTLEVLAPSSINKKFLPTTIFVDGISTITFTLTNPNTLSALTGVGFTDTFPADLKVANPPNASTTGCDNSSSPTFAPLANATSLVFSNGSITGDGTCTITVDVIGTAIGEKDNITGQVTSTEGGTGATSNTATLTVINPSLGLNKSISAGDPYDVVGGTISYNYILMNTGNVTLIGPGTGGVFTVTDDKLTVTCPATPAGLAPSSTVTCTGTYAVTQADLDSGSVTNIAQAHGLYDTTPIESNQDVETASADQRPSIELTKTGTIDMTIEGFSAVADIGDEIVYIFAIENVGNVTLTNITLADTVGGVTISGGSIASLAPGIVDNSTFSGSYTLTKTDVDAGSFTNTATTTGTPPTGDDVSDPDEEIVTITAYPLIGTAKRLVGSPEKVSPGTWDVTFEIYVKNYGNVTLDSVQMTDDITLTFPSPTTFTIQSVTSSDFNVNWPGYNGDVNLNLLEGTDSLDSGADGTLTLVVRVIPANGGPFENTAIAIGSPPNGEPVSDDSQDGTNPDPDPSDGDPTNNDDPTPIDFGPNLFDPPFGIKVLDSSGSAQLLWRVIWINDTNIVAINAEAGDEIPENTLFVDDGISSGYPLPGTYPDGSTNNGVSCIDYSEITTTEYCYYEGPTLTYPRGRIVWVGDLGPDLGATNATEAIHEIHILFKVDVNNGIRRVTNIATIDADLNGDGDVDDPGEQEVSTASEFWFDPPELPDTGFSPGKITILPAQPFELAYAQLNGMVLEIPGLDLEMNITNIPLVNDKWDVTWLGNDAGHLTGSAFPTFNGNTVITGHVWDALNQPGPFAQLKSLNYGDQFMIRAWGQVYTYEIREVRLVRESSVEYVMQHEDFDWVTLVTCENYSSQSDRYRYRRVVRAVLVSVD